jgi:hypothetical protein
MRTNQAVRGDAVPKWMMFLAARNAQRSDSTALFQFKLMGGCSVVGTYLGEFECCGGFGVEGGAVGALDGSQPGSEACFDIGKQAVTVTVRVPSGTRRGGRAQETREFGTTRRQLLELAGWLRPWGVERAGMESTSDYWKPVFFLLEQQRFDCMLYQAAKVKAQPGRPKTGKLDSVWLAKVTERGSVAGSFVPPEDVRRLRTRTRYRRRLTQARTAEKQRVEKLLEDAR